MAGEPTFFSECITIGTGPAISYGELVPLQAAYLSVQSGSIKDLVTGTLGKGIGRVRGTVKEKGSPNSPVYRKVRLLRERDGLQIREMFSDPLTGAYDFTYVDELVSYTVISYDFNKSYRAVIADNLTPELMVP